MKGVAVRIRSLPCQFFPRDSQLNQIPEITARSTPAPHTSGGVERRTRIFSACRMDCICRKSSDMLVLMIR